MRSFTFFSSLCLWWQLLASPGWAADLHCGRDTDQNGSVDTACPSPDADFDGEKAVASGGYDCDDTDWSMTVGVSTQGADNTKYKTCQANGSFTGGSDLLSAYTCHTGSGHTYWVDDAETDCTGAGTYADPEDYRCWFSTGMSGYHAPAAGDCIVLQAGTYSAKWGSTPEKMFYVNGIAGTSSNPIRLRVEPGKVAIIEGQGVSPNYIVPIYLEDSDYWEIDGNDAGKKPGLTIHGNYAAAGVEFHNSDYDSIQNAYIYDVDGNCGTDNCGGVKITSGATHATVRAVQIKDTYNRSAGTNPNGANLYASLGDGHSFLYNTLIASSNSVVGEHMFFKHCDSSGTATWTYKGNVSYKGVNSHLDTSCGGATISHNVFLSSASFGIAFTGVGGNGGSYFSAPSTVSYNTVNDGLAINLFAPGSYEQSSTFGNVTVDHNIFVDNRAVASEFGSYRICHYCSDAIYTAIVTGDKIDFHDNCVYNLGAAALSYSIFGDNSSTSYGATYANFSAWQSQGLVTAIDEYYENPTLSAANVATSTNCDDKGWNIEEVAPTPTPTATPSTSGFSRIRGRKR